MTFTERLRNQLSKQMDEGVLGNKTLLVVPNQRAIITTSLCKWYDTGRAHHDVNILLRYYSGQILLHIIWAVPGSSHGNTIVIAVLKMCAERLGIITTIVAIPRQQCFWNPA